jgi:hypothetical protein
VTKTSFFSIKPVSIMAKKKDNTLKLAGLALLGFGLYTMMNRSGNGNGNQPPNYQNVPPPPAPTANDQTWQQWAGAIISSVGVVASLWQPGGPFYNNPNAPTPEEANQLAQGMEYFNLYGP